MNKHFKNSIMKGSIYFFKENYGETIKIGFSKDENPLSRVSKFKTLLPYGGELIGYFTNENAKDLEKELHKDYADYRLNGEWFDIPKKEAELLIEENNGVILDKSKMSLSELIEYSFYSSTYFVKELNIDSNYYHKNHIIEDINNMTVSNFSKLSEILNVDFKTLYSAYLKERKNALK